MIPEATIRVPEIATRLRIGIDKVYELLHDGTIPSLHRGRNYIISRHRYEQWERTFGDIPKAATQPEEPSVSFPPLGARGR